MREFKGSSIIALPSDYIVIDTETTGLDYDFCDIIEIAAIRYNDGQIVDKFSTLVQPPVSIYYDDDDNECQEYVCKFITELTGITNEMLESAPTPDVVLPQFIDFIGDSVLVGHNVNFDINFLYDASVNHCGAAISNNFIDTMRIARKLFTHLKHHRLKDIAAECKISNPNAHRAEADCLVTGQCYETMRRIILETQTEEEFQCAFKRKYHGKNIAYTVVPAEEVDDSNPIFGKTVVFTGALSSLARKDAFQIVANLGGTPSNSVTTKTNYLVIGNLDYVHSVKQGKTSKILTAEDYQKKGREIMILSENSFFEMISTYI